MKYLVFTANVSTSIQIYQELLLDYYSILVREQQYFLKVNSLNIDTYFNWVTEVVLLDQLYPNLGVKLKGLTKYSTCDIRGYLHEKYPRVTGILSAGFPRVQMHYLHICKLIDITDCSLSVIVNRDDLGLINSSICSFLVSTEAGDLVGLVSNEFVMEIYEILVYSTSYNKKFNPSFF
ncbi:hypothetical protein BT96DRAFT_936535 [Gymnopus androsaceus JB14]|uniref:Uncharacterized protein n=1 Tax=Gymnopus androsaceus JB14 TaxID=1447944 RepID=A0A6A4I3B3_9AGAR|nr:hypothetical protein BT96DRAFT_936535 [Gymnopus androsaceus JB14]